MIFDAFAISFKIVITSLTISLIISFLAVRLLVEKDIRGKKILETLMLFPMFLPPSAVGYIILIVIGREGFIGKVIHNYFGVNIIFTWIAGVIAAVIVSMPIMYQSIKISILSVNKELREAARVMGATEFQIFYKITLPLSIKGILTGILLSFARSFGEFGATILVAGNIPGKTQTVPMAMYYAIENNNDTQAKTILVFILLISMILIFFYNIVLKKFV